MELKLTDNDFIRLVEFVKKNYGIDLGKKRVLLEGRLSRTLAEKNYTSFTEYIDMLFKDRTGKEIITFLNKITTNHTFFMREPEHFEFMKTVILPYIEQTVKAKIAKIWCAASSSGEEPYTMAMVIDDYFGIRKAGWNLKILATDISENVLEKARKGVYAPETLKDIPKAWKLKYFKQLPDGNFQVVDSIRQQVEYKKFNLMDPIPQFSKYDFISCRNVMIYFDLETKNALVERFYDVLKDGGYFFTGHAESVTKTSRFTYVKPAIYRKIVNTL
ncbi:MAG: protein-glutamate O-methyltransferase CheR [Oscillospiraceae bacterium]|jgi:chemotaxis protein methyltransferase CheR|nr:protein-glutamate O-methyltransferase CheR [Oscillospiraceae bacterium]